MSSPFRTIYIEPLAPQKPALGAPCNGCGVCCLVAPCPLGMLLSGRRSGACAALRWDARAAIFRCGAVHKPLPVAQSFLPTGLQWSAPVLAFLLKRFARRWIAAGKGCDSSLEAQWATGSPVPPAHAERPSSR